MKDADALISGLLMAISWIAIFGALWLVLKMCL